MKRIALLALLLAACRHGEGTAIEEFGECKVLNAKSVCASGLFCDPSKSQKGEVLEGNTYVVYGACMRQKKAGEACRTDVPGMCETPLVCTVEGGQDVDALQRHLAHEGHCQPQQTQ